MCREEMPEDYQPEINEDLQQMFKDEHPEEFEKGYEFLL